MNGDQKHALAVGGIGVAACAACCAGPLAAAVGAAGLGPIGAGAAVVVGGIAFIRHRRRSPDAGDVDEFADIHSP